MELREFAKLAVSPGRIWEMAARGKQSRGRIFDAIHNLTDPKSRHLSDHLAKRTGQQYDHLEYHVDKKLGGRLSKASMPARQKSFMDMVRAQGRHPASDAFNDRIIHHLSARD